MTTNDMAVSLRESFMQSLKLYLRMNPLQPFDSKLVHFNAHRRIDRISIAWWRIGVACYILGRRKN